RTIFAPRPTVAGRRGTQRRQSPPDRTQQPDDPSTTLMTTGTSRWFRENPLIDPRGKGQYWGQGTHVI
ncbi:MAG: hypothetical protein M0Z96_06275, partial [Actinomycetota bacterium]|nr:hypothetical protein [Actinomycetota bacterium]